MASNFPLAARIAAKVIRALLAVRDITLIPLLLLVLAATLRAADLGDVNVRLEDYDGPASVVARRIAPFRFQLTFKPGDGPQPRLIRVELPTSGPQVWPAADVEVRDAQGRAVLVRRSGIEWAKLLIPVPATAGDYFVQVVPPAGENPSPPSEKERALVDAVTGLKIGVAKWHDGRKAALSLRFDDSHPTHLTTAIPLLREYGFRGTFMINPGRSEPGSRRRSDFELHRAEWAAVARQGDHELANHSAHHRGARGDDDMDAEIGRAAEAIWQLTPGRSKLTALNLGGGTYWETTHTLRHYLDKFHQFDASQNSTGMDDAYGNRVANFRRILEQHLLRGLWLRTHYHSIGEGLASSAANLRAVLDIAREHEPDLWIAGLADIHKYQSERDASRLRVRTSAPGRLVFELDCRTDAALYNQPLTLELTPPPSWPAGRLKVMEAQGEIIPLHPAKSAGTAVLRFDVPPRTAAYAIELAP